MTNEQRATREAEGALVGRRITAVRYMTAREANNLCWNHRGLVVEFDDGSRMFASADEAMNDAGALFFERGDDELCFGRFPA